MSKSTTVAWSCHVETPLGVLAASCPVEAPVAALPPISGGAPTSAPKGLDWGWRVYGEIIEAERRIANRRAYHARLDLMAGSAAYLDSLN